MILVEMKKKRNELNHQESGYPVYYGFSEPSTRIPHVISVIIRIHAANLWKLNRVDVNFLRKFLQRHHGRSRMSKEDVQGIPEKQIKSLNF